MNVCEVNFFFVFNLEFYLNFRNNGIAYVALKMPFCFEQKFSKNYKSTSLSLKTGMITLISIGTEAATIFIMMI